MRFFIAQVRSRSGIAMDDPGLGQWVSLHQPQELLPSDIARPRAPRQPFAPKPPRLFDNRSQSLVVAADAKVGKMPLEHLAKSTLLVGQRPGSHAPALLVDRLERPRQTIFGGALPQRRVAPPRLAPYVEKAEKVERRGQRRFCTSALGRRSEVNQAGLV